MKKILVFVLAVLLVLSGCSKEDMENHKTIASHEFNLTKTNIKVGYEAGFEYIHLNTDMAISWTATSSADWLSVSPTSGTGFGNICVTWQENTTASERDATVTISEAQMSLKLSVKQGQKPAELVGTRAILGNQIINEMDSVEFIFDKPVGALTVSSGSDLYAISTKAEKMDNDGLCWRLPLKGSKQGRDIQLSIAYKPTSDWKERKTGVTVPFYQKRYLLSEESGWINYSTLSPDKGSIWLSVQNLDASQNKVVQVSLDDMTVKQSVKMPFAPHHLCINPYNGRLYVMGNTNYFCVVDPAKGEIVKTVEVENSKNAHPQHPLNNATEVAFTKDGFGILLVVSNSSTALEWRYIDSADDDKVTQHGYNNWSEQQVEHVYTNYDYTRIYATMYSRSYTTMEWFNRQNQVPVEIKINGHFNSDKEFAGGSLVDLQMSPFANKAFICTAPGSECVVTLEPVSYSEVLEEEARGSKCVWDEAVTDCDYVYLVNAIGDAIGGFIELLDMTGGRGIFGTEHIFVGQNKAKNCHFLPASDQLVISCLTGIYVLDAAEMKSKKRI